MDIQISDTFRYNSDFTATSVRLKINVLQQEQSGEERKATETKVLVDRQHQVHRRIKTIIKNKDDWGGVVKEEREKSQGMNEWIYLGMMNYLT